MARACSVSRYPRLPASLAKTEVLVIDDFGLAKLGAENHRDLLEVIEDRHGIRSTVATSQLPGREVARRHRRPHPGRCPGRQFRAPLQTDRGGRRRRRHEAARLDGSRLPYADSAWTEMTDEEARRTMSEEAWRLLTAPGPETIWEKSMRV